MTEKDLAILAQTIAPIVREAVATAVHDAETRLAVAEAQLKAIGDIRDRVVVMETKAALPAILQTAGPTEADVELSVKDAIEPIKAALAAAQERIAILETRQPVPGPAGKDGAPGLDGKDGAPGRDGLAGMDYKGVFEEGASYERGHLVTWGGSGWHCNEPTTTKPGEGSKAWTLMVKRGRDGKDGRDAEVAPVVSLGSRK